MSEFDSCAVLSPRLVKVVSTCASTESPLSKWLSTGEEASGHWQGLLDQLSEWERDPMGVTDDEIDPPTEQSLRLAEALAESLRAAGADCPDRVVLDPNGGIVFRYCAGTVAEVFHIWDDGTIDRCIFDGTRLINREAVTTLVAA